MNDFHFAYPYFLYLALALFIGALVYRLWLYKPVTYHYALTHFLARKNVHAPWVIPTIFFVLRMLTIGLLVFLVGKPQIPDRRTQINVNGIDIVLVLDASGSMMCFDDMHNRQSRMSIAKQEAIRFIDQRTNDALGIVTFGNGALTACPLTHDRSVLKEIIENINVGSMVDDRATLLSYGILTALNRLKNSICPSKVMIVLTDGQPSMHDAPIHVPITIAKQMGVKIYTIGIGNDQGGFCAGPHGMLFAQGTQLNEQLLTTIAEQTGGCFYRAKDAAQLRTIYQKIDTLEKQRMTVNLYSKYTDIFEPFLWVILCVLALELVLSVFVWRVL